MCCRQQQQTLLVLNFGIVSNRFALADDNTYARCKGEGRKQKVGSVCKLSVGNDCCFWSFNVAALCQLIILVGEDELNEA